MKKLQFFFFVVFMATLLGACSKDDYNAQIDELRRLNIDLQNKITAVDQKVEPKDQTQASREVLEKSINDLRQVIERMGKQINVLRVNQKAQQAHLVATDEILVAIATYAVGTEAALGKTTEDLRKAEKSIQSITTTMASLVSQQQLTITLEELTKKHNDNVEAKIDELRTEFNTDLGLLIEALAENDADLRTELQALRTRVTAAETREAIRELREQFRAFLVRAQSTVDRRIALATAAANTILSGLQGLLQRLYVIPPWPPMMPPAAP